jgi:cytosine/adenosine deaminase-related metal-dependent hydrolase
MIVGGSDWDVSSYNPFRAFQVAVTRAGGPGQKPLNIDERIPLETAIDAYTNNAAYAMKQDKITGTLEVGKRADLVVLDRDILTTDPETIEDTKVLATYLDGRLVYSAQPGSKAEDAKDEDDLLQKGKANGLTRLGRRLDGGTLRSPYKPNPTFRQGEMRLSPAIN